MRYKSKVLARYPDARLEALDRWDDGTPRYQRVVAGPEGATVILDIYDCDYLRQQGATAAWRSAYYWMVRQARATSVRTVTLDEAFDNPTGWMTGRKS